MEARPTESGARAGMPLVELKGVCKSYGEKNAVLPLDLTLYAGEVFAFLGPNGAGKTTTLKMTTGLLRPDAGAVSICGVDLQAQPELAKQWIAYVPDQPFLYDKLTGREFIHFVRDMYGVPREPAAERLERLTSLLDMSGFLDQLTESYSHGMKQKVALSAALIHEPRLLVVDEPIVGLDPRTIRIIKELFREVAASGGVVFMSTHTLDVAEATADRIGILNQGELVALGTLDELRTASTHGRLEDIFLDITHAQVDPPRNGAPQSSDDDSLPRIDRASA